METCQRLREEVVRYIAHHYDPDRDENRQETIWTDAVDQVLGPISEVNATAPIEVTPRNAEEADAPIRLLDAFNEIVAASSAPENLSEKYAQQALGIEIQRLEKLDRLPEQGLPAESIWHVVATWLINTPNGAWDATGAFDDVADFVEELSVTPPKGGLNDESD